MASIEILKHIIRVLNIKDADDIVFNRLEVTLAEIDGVGKYVGYLEKYHNHIDLDYMSGYQKFLELTKRYKEYEAEHRAKEGLALVPSRAIELVGKVKTVGNTFIESEYQRNSLGYRHKMLGYHSFKGFFTEEDKAILRTVGNLNKCVRMLSLVSGENTLEIKLIAILRSIAIRGASTKNVLENRMSENIAKLAKTTIRKF